MLKFLPEKIRLGLTNVNLQQVYELRLRVDRPTTVNVLGEYKYLTNYGASDSMTHALKCDQGELEECIYKAGDFSVYSVEEQIKNGFITTANGIRIGLAGEYVFEKDKPFSIRKVTSLCIRIPHEVVGCGDEIYDECLKENMCNILINSPPGMGKTTILRDLARRISESFRINVLVCDERGELSVGSYGDTCDVLKFADKATAFRMGIRAMRPDVIVTDELSEEDIYAVKNAIGGGVYVLASAHVSTYEKLPNAFLNVFDRYAFLSNARVGSIREIYDGSGKRIWSGQKK